MTRQHTHHAESDPSTTLVDLLDREDLPVVAERSDHEGADHCGAGIEGRVVVGVVDGGSVLLLVHEEASVGMLPNGTIEAGDDPVAVARRTVREETGLSVDIEEPVLIREIDHHLDGQQGVDATTHNVVFRASRADPDATVDPAVTEGDWTPGWYDEFGDPFAETDGRLADDIRLFVD